MKISKYLNNLVAIIIFPLSLIWWVIKPLFRFILKNEIKSEKNKYEDLAKEYRETKIKLSDTEGLNKLLNDKTNRLNALINSYHNYEAEFDKTKKDENAIIFSPRHKESYSIYLCGMDGKHETNDCRINLTKFCQELKIDDIISNTKKRGYARTLLNYTIKKAQASGIERIYGDLSPVDADSFSWLIPFYESLGFTCILSNDKQMGGKLELKLIKPDKITPC